MADLLTALGVPRVNLFGASYGSRAALVFFRRHPSRVRSAVIEGVVGPNMIIPLGAARGARHALDAAFTACAADSLCHAHAPDPAGDLLSVRARLRDAPVRVTLWNGWRLRHEQLTITSRGFAERAFSMIYDPADARRLLALVHAAAAGDWTPFARAAIDDSRRRKADRSVGMMLSVLCTEDAPRLARADTARIGRESPLGLPLAHEILRACAVWPHGLLSPDDTLPVASTLDVLLISGALDPVAPIDWADSARTLWAASQHYVEPNAGHAVLDACTTALTASFIERGRASGLDAVGPVCP
jgi:pimeloyl-ACP methyl ester carboxylesterase